MVRFLAALIFALLASIGSAFSQTTGPVSEFDVASVKIAGPEVPQTLIRMRGGPGTNDPTRFTYMGANLQSLIMRAYGVRTDQTSGPDWVKDFSDSRTLYTVSVVIPSGTSKEQFDLMLRNLLRERFHLVMHHEAKEFPGYELGVAEGGPKITACIQAEEAASSAGSAPAAGKKNCRALPGGASMSTALSSRIGAWGTIRQKFIMPMTEFAEQLGVAINEANGMEAGTAMPRVADKTGLSGTYDFNLAFSGIVVMPGMTLPAAGGGDPGNAGPTLFNALETQLGLKLLKTKNVPVDILVIDHADKVPTEN